MTAAPGTVRLEQGDDRRARLASRSCSMSDIGPPLVRRYRGSGLAAGSVRRPRSRPSPRRRRRRPTGSRLSSTRRTASGSGPAASGDHPVGADVVDADPDRGPGSAQVADPRAEHPSGARRASARRRVRRAGRAGSGPGASGSRRRRSGRAGGASGGWRTGRAGLCGSRRARPPAGRGAREASVHHCCIHCAAGVVGHRLGHGLMTARRAGVGQQRVGAVEQPELAVFVRVDVVGQGGAGLVPLRPSGGEGAAEHPLVERLRADRAAVVDARALPRRVRRSSGVVRGVIRSTTVVTHETDRSIQSARAGSTSSARSRTTRAATAPLPGRLSQGTSVSGPASACAAGGAARGQPGRCGVHDRGRVAAQGRDVRLHPGVVAV